MEQKNKNREIIYSVKKEHGLSIEELKVLLKKWQEKLQMEEWKLSVKIVDFKRSDNFRQSGDFVADPIKKTATILMTWDPWRGDEEYTLVHELMHVLVYDQDKFCEDLILKNIKDEKIHAEYMDVLEDLVHNLTKIVLGRSDR